MPKSFDIAHFELEGDAQAVIHRINSFQDDLSMTGYLIVGIRSLIKQFPVIRLNFVNRKLNRAAHEDAKLSLKARGRIVWFTNFPPCNGCCKS